MSETQKLKVVVPPEVLEKMERDFGAEELQTILDDIQRMADDGTLLENSQQLDLNIMESEDPETFSALMKEATDRGYQTIEEWMEAELSTIPPTLN